MEVKVHINKAVYS